MIYRRNTDLISLGEIMTIDEAELFEFTESEIVSLNEGFFESVKKFFIELRDRIMKFFKMIISKFKSSSNNDKKDLNDLNNAVKQTPPSSKDSENSEEDNTEKENEEDEPPASEDDSEQASPIKQAVKIAKRAHFRDKYSSLEQVLEAGLKSPNFVVKSSTVHDSVFFNHSAEFWVDPLFMKIKQISNDLMNGAKTKLFDVELDKLYLFKAREGLITNMCFELCRDLDKDYSTKTEYYGWSDVNKVYRKLFIGTEYDGEEPHTTDLDAKDFRGVTPKMFLDVLSSQTADDEKCIGEMESGIDNLIKEFVSKLSKTIEEIDKEKNAYYDAHEEEINPRDYKWSEPFDNKRHIVEAKITIMKSLLSCFFDITRYAVRFIANRRKLASKAILSMIRASYKDMNDVKTESYSSSIFSNLVLI